MLYRKSINGAYFPSEKATRLLLVWYTVDNFILKYKRTPTFLELLEDPDIKVTTSRSGGSFNINTLTTQLGQYLRYHKYPLKRGDIKNCVTYPIGNTIGKHI